MAVGKSKFAIVNQKKCVEYGLCVKICPASIITIHAVSKIKENCIDGN